MGTFRKVEFAYLSINGSDNIADQLEDVPSFLISPTVVPLPLVNADLQPSGTTTSTGAFNCMIRSGVADSTANVDNILGGDPAGSGAAKESLTGKVVRIKAQEKTADPLGTATTAAPMEIADVLIGPLPTYPPGAVGSKAIWSVTGVINKYERITTGDDFS